MLAVIATFAEGELFREVINFAYLDKMSVFRLEIPHLRSWSTKNVCVALDNPHTNFTLVFQAQNT